MPDVNATPNPKQCPKCGRPHTTSLGLLSCQGHKRSGAPCGNDPMRDQLVCRMHGGSAPQAKAKAVVRAQTAEAVRAVATLGARRDISPSDALLEEVQWTAGHVAWLRSKVQEIEAAAARPTDQDADELEPPVDGHPLVWGQTEYRKKTGGEDWGTTTVEKAAPSIWYELYAKERGHLVAVCAAALKAGVEARRIKLAEDQGALLAGAIRGILADLGLSETQQALVGEVVPRHLRLIAGGGA